METSLSPASVPGASFAGMYETYLQVGADDLPAAVHRCFESAGTDRIRTYQSSVPGDGPAVRPDSAMAVLVQQMVVPAAAGVAFTANPLTGARDETVISAVPGLAEKLVSGVATGEEWVARSGRPRLTRGSGSALTEQSATAVAAVASAVALHFGCPQDIEWAVDHAGKVHILQSRPMTALPDPVTWEPPGKGAWLRNFRMGEWLPEAVTPLFMDWAIPRIDAAYDEAVYKSAGIKVPMGHAAVNGWYYVAPPTPRALPHLLFGGKRSSLPYFFNSVVRPMFDPAGADRTVLRALEHEWRTVCLPVYRNLVDTSHADDGTAGPDELCHTVEKVMQAAGEYLWYFAATGGRSLEDGSRACRILAATPGRGARRWGRARLGPKNWLPGPPQRSRAGVDVPRPGPTGRPPPGFGHQPLAAAC
ncbi:MAG: PEP/pyruvate-binding domain-containing protein [Actinomycetota bacterium]|nr:PEP/pyruvate-binding domain-containing protein [Actinomycetota bacterium]